MSSWIQKASSLIDTIDQVATQQVEDETTEEQTQQDKEEREEAEEEQEKEKDVETETERIETSDNEAPPLNAASGVSLAKQYEGIVALWNAERGNLKRAQQLLRKQKERFELSSEAQRKEHLLSITAINDKHSQSIKAKEEEIEAIKALLVQVKEERNHTMDDTQQLKDKINRFQTENDKILKQNEANALKKQQEIERIRNEFDKERANWDKERKILTKNFERETFLENENVEYTNALARTQSTLHHKEIENARLKSELKWCKKEKNEMKSANELIKQESDALHKEVERLQRMIGDHKQQMMRVKEEESERNNELQVENKQLKQQLELQLKSNEQPKIDYAKSTKQFEQRMNDLTTSLLQKQTQLDMVMSQKNELKMELDKVMKSNASSANNDKKDIETGLIRRGIMNTRNNKAILNRDRRNYTSYKSINYGIGVFDRIGLEFAHVLRNRPWIRLMIVFYIIVLHLWCFIVLHFSMNFSEDDEHH
eukprot:3536_1